MSEKYIQLSRSPNLGLLVVIGGPGASGSSTIAKMVAEKFGLTRYNAGGIFREIAKERGYSEVKDFLADVESNKEGGYDLEIDNRMIRASQTSNVLIEAKAFAALTTIRHIPCTIKIWLTADIETRVRRIFSKKGILEYGMPITEELKGMYKKEKESLLEREEIDLKKFNFLYGIDYENQGLYNDIIIDSSKQTVEETFNLTCKKIEEMEEKTKNNIPVSNTDNSMDDLEVSWRRWKCLVCGYLYEGTDIQLKCPRCGNEDARKFQDID